MDNLKPLTTLREYKFEHEDDEYRKMAIKIYESPGEEFGSFTWPSAITLSGYLWKLGRPYFQGKRVIELGCGTGLPGIVAAACGAHVTFTDSSEASEILKSLRISILTNSPVHWWNSSSSFEPITLKTKTMTFDWGNFDYNFLALFDDTLPPIDTIIASDCFYDNDQDFQDLFATIRFIFDKNPNSTFFVTYHPRTTDCQLPWLCQKWGIKSKVIDHYSSQPLHQDVTVILLELSLAY